MDTSEVLNKAADLIEERGWTQGCGGFYGRGGLCVLGAVAAALGVNMRSGLSRGDLYRSPQVSALRTYLDVRATDPWDAADALWSWNDAAGRTASEVIEALRAVAVIEAAREQAAVEVSA